MSAISSEDIEILRGCNIHITLADMIQNSNLNLPAVDDLTTDQHNPTIFDYSKNKPVKIVMICAGSLDERILHPRVAKNKVKNGRSSENEGNSRGIWLCWPTFLGVPGWPAKKLIIISKIHFFFRLRGFSNN